MEGGPPHPLPTGRQASLSPLRLCHNSVHGSRTSPRTEYDLLEIIQLAVRPECVEGRMANYDTVSLGRGEDRFDSQPR
jgi:hypothetical protein